jgi:dolichyl-phosphate-mannose-protein mannosyltransferase
MVFGVAGALLVYLLALTLWRSPGWAGLAGLLVALDGVHIVQSRLAMLDIFMSTFILGGVLCAVLEYQRRKGIPVPAVTSNRVVGSRYLLGTGVLLGAAVATKWTGLFILGPVIVVGALSLVAPAPPEDGPIRRRALNAAISLLVAPMAVYVASYLMFFVQHGPAVGAFVDLQAAMFHHQWIHSHAQATASAPISWPLLAHPIRYIWDGAATREVVLVGNPLLWWGFLAALPLLVYRVARYRRGRSSWCSAAICCCTAPGWSSPAPGSSSTCSRRSRSWPLAWSRSCDRSPVPAVGPGRLAAVPAPHRVVRSGRTITS